MSIRILRTLFWTTVSEYRRIRMRRKKIYRYTDLKFSPFHVLPVFLHRTKSISIYYYYVIKLKRGKKIKSACTKNA